MTKRRLMILIGALCAVAILVFVNQAKPARLAAATLDRTAQVQQRLAAIDARGDAIVLAQGTGAKEEEKAAADDAPMPNVFRVRYDTSKGPVVIELHKEWAPNGVARFYELVKMGFFDGCRFFRVVTKPKPFVVQWGIPGEPKLAKKWNNRTIKDDKVMKTNAVGTVTFAAGRAPNSRSTQLFINLGDNKFLDGMGFAPIGYVVEGMEIVRQFNDEYQEKVTDRQGDIVSKGNAWLDEAFPGLDYVKKATIVK